MTEAGRGAPARPANHRKLGSGGKRTLSHPEGPSLPRSIPAPGLRNWETATSVRPLRRR